LKNFNKYLHLKKACSAEQDRNMPNEKLINEILNEIDFVWKKLTNEERDELRKLNALGE